MVIKWAPKKNVEFQASPLAPPPAPFLQRQKNLFLSHHFRFMGFHWACIQVQASPPPRTHAAFLQRQNNIFISHQWRLTGFYSGYRCLTNSKGGHRGMSTVQNSTVKRILDIIIFSTMSSEKPLSTWTRLIICWLCSAMTHLRIKNADSETKRLLKEKKRNLLQTFSLLCSQWH